MTCCSTMDSKKLPQPIPYQGSCGIVSDRGPSYGLHFCVHTWFYSSSGYEYYHSRPNRQLHYSPRAQFLRGRSEPPAQSVRLIAIHQANTHPASHSHTRQNSIAAHTKLWSPSSSMAYTRVGLDGELDHPQSHRPNCNSCCLHLVNLAEPGAGSPYWVYQP